MRENMVQKTEVGAQALTSMEVAEMVEKEHRNIVRDIRRYTSQFNQLKIEHIDFWEESTYMDAHKQQRPCYLITKKGCEFIAHKLTGVKGTAFTARVIILDLSADKKRGEKMTARMGRPPVTNPKSERITVRMDKECSDILKKYCEKYGKDRAEAIREGIRKLKEK